MKSRAELEVAVDRRMLLRLAACAGLGAMMPHVAQAAASKDSLPRVRALLDKWVGPGKFPGVVASLGRRGRDPEFVIRGSQGFTDPTPLTPDSLFRIYSMTKPVTGMAAMQLIAEGKLALDQPLYEFLPRFRNMTVQNTYDGSIIAVHPAPRPITIRHLLTHTAGLGYAIVQRGPIVQLLEDKGLIPGQVTRMPIAGFTRAKSVRGLEVFCDRLAQVPLVLDPGTQWSYGMGLDVMGRVIEVVTGRPFDVYLKEAIFDPAGMSSTFFQVPAAEAKRLTTNYGVMRGIFVAIDEGAKSLYLDPPPAPFGGAGLVSSPRDYDRFLRMLAQHGQIGGKRVLAEKAVRLGTSNLLPAGVPGPAIMGPSAGFGAGGRVGAGADAGLFGWAGAAGTVGVVDMNRAMRSQIFAQFMPSDSMELLPEFQVALKADIAALVEKR